MQFEQRHFLRLLVDSNAPKKEETQSEMLVKTNSNNSNKQIKELYIVSHISKDVEDNRKFDRPYPGCQRFFMRGFRYRSCLY